MHEVQRDAHHDMLYAFVLEQRADEHYCPEHMLRIMEGEWLKRGHFVHRSPRR